VAETYEAFIDDVVTGKIDRKDLRELPHTVNAIQTGVKQEFERVENALSSNIEKISTTQAVLHQNQLEFSQNLVSHTQMVKTISEAAQSVSKAADTIREVTESLKESLQIFRQGVEFLMHAKDSSDISGKSRGLDEKGKAPGSFESSNHVSATTPRCYQDHLLHPVCTLCLCQFLRHPCDTVKLHLILPWYFRSTDVTKNEEILLEGIQVFSGFFILIFLSVNCSYMKKNISSMSFSGSSI
jgi:hypothetical protein